MTSQTKQTYAEVLYTVARAFLLDWYERDGESVAEEDIDDGIVDCVAGAIDEALKGSKAAYYSRLEGSSTYVQCDLNEDELEEYVDALEGAIDGYELASYL